MSLIDLNLNEFGDIEINSNGDIGNNSMDVMEAQRLTIMSMIQKLFLFNNDLQNKFIKRKIEIGLDDEIEAYILNKIKTEFMIESESDLIMATCLLNKNAAEVYFSYLDLFGEPSMLMRYNILL